jgi:hypothetical protein
MVDMASWNEIEFVQGMMAGRHGNASRGYRSFLCLTARD